MTTPLLCLVLYASWAILLVLGVASWRVTLVMLKRKRSNEFTPGAQHGTDMYWRLNRAHLNVVENLPIFATVVLAARLAEVGGAWLDSACIVVIVARVAQSLIHVSSATAVAVNLRFTAFMTQLFSIGYVIVRLLAAATS
jgi:uncharacterized MAPEG superfamily protein